MTSSQEPPHSQPENAQEDAPTPDLLAERPQHAEQPGPDRPPPQERSRRPRPEQNPVLDPRLAQLERRSRPTSRTGDVSLMMIGVVAFIFGVAMHYWVATSILNSGSSAASSTDVAATATPAIDTSAVTPTVAPPPTDTPLPDRTSCDAIRGTQYRSVAERQFFLANCTGQQPAQTQPTEAAPQSTQSAPQTTQVP